MDNSFLHTTRLLLVDDEQELLKMVSDILKDAGFETVLTAMTVKEAILTAKEETPDLIVLDVMLPDGDGFSLMQHFHTFTNVPIIFLTAKDEAADKLSGLGLGADDYILKPFDSKEMVARVRAVLRRFQPKQTPVISDEKCATYPDLTVNLTNYSVTYMGKQVDMPPKELELLYFLASSPNQVFTREQLLDHIWGYEYIGDTRTVDVHIKRLREKIKDHPSWSISTVWGIGYKFEVRNE